MHYLRRERKPRAMQALLEWRGAVPDSQLFTEFKRVLVTKENLDLTPAQQTLLTDVMEEFKNHFSSALKVLKNAGPLLKDAERAENAANDVRNTVEEAVQQLIIINAEIFKAKKEKDRAFNRLIQVHDVIGHDLLEQQYKKWYDTYEPILGFGLCFSLMQLQYGNEAHLLIGKCRRLV